MHTDYVLLDQYFGKAGIPVGYFPLVGYKLTVNAGSYILSGTDIGLYWWLWNACRGYIIPAEDRTFAIPAEDRTFVIPACDDGGK